MLLTSASRTLSACALAALFIGCPSVREPDAGRAATPSETLGADSGPTCVRPLGAVAPKENRSVDPACPAQNDSAAAVVRVPLMSPSGVEMQVEIARTEAERERGLMFRRSLPESGGMIFVFDETREHTFWMHDTCISLDLVYLDVNGFVVGVVEAAPTMNDDSLSVGCPSRYVLEVGAGRARPLGLVPGARLGVEAIR